MSDILGIAGFIISLINFVYFFIIRRKNIIVNFGSYGIKNYIKNQKMLLIHYRFDNNSQLSIAITRIQLVVNNKKYDCDNMPIIATKYRYKEGNETVYQHFTKTDVLPINLLPLASHSEYLGFVIPRDILSNVERVLTFRICTNRGKAVQKTFVLHEDIRLR